MRGLWLACLVPAAASAQTLPDEVRLSSLEAARGVCADMAADGRRRDAALETVYVMGVDPAGFAFTAYDARRARLGLDTLSFRGPGGLEVVLHDLLGSTRATGLDLSVPATAEEAEAMTRAHRARSLSLEVWFRVARTADGRPVCAASHRGATDGLRLAVEPLAFEIRQGQQRVASGETAAFAALRAENGPVLDPRVVIGTPMRTSVRGRAPAAAARAAVALERELVACYRRGLTTDPFLRGPLALGVEVAADGRVAAVHAELDGLGAPEVVTCAIDAVRAARFPRGAARLSIPLRFTD